MSPGMFDRRAEDLRTVASELEQRAKRLRTMAQDIEFNPFTGNRVCLCTDAESRHTGANTDGRPRICMVYGCTCIEFRPEAPV